MLADKQAEYVFCELRAAGGRQVVHVPAVVKGELAREAREAVAVANAVDRNVYIGNAVFLKDGKRGLEQYRFRDAFSGAQNLEIQLRLVVLAFLERRARMFIDVKQEDRFGKLADRTQALLCHRRAVRVLELHVALTVFLKRCFRGLESVVAGDVTRALEEIPR